MQKILNIISLTINSIILLILLFIVISNIIDINSAGAIGVIGGDGPTAIFFSSPYPFVIPFIFIAFVFIVYEIVFLVNLRNKSNKVKNLE